MCNWTSKDLTRDLHERMPSEGGSTRRLNAPAAPLASDEPYCCAMDDAVDASRRVSGPKTNREEAASWGSSARWSGEELANLVRDAARGEAVAWSALGNRLGPLGWSIIQGYRLGARDAADGSQPTRLRLARPIDPP